MKPILTLDLLCQEAKIFAEIESNHHESSLYGVTDGKALGTYFEHKFQDYAEQLADEVLHHPPDLGYLTISNALQWRLQYRRVIAEAGNIPGIIRVL